MRSDAARLADILEAIATIQRHATCDLERYQRDETLRWFFRSQVQIIGEACFKLSAALRDSHPEVPWQAITGMRHILVHDYFKADWEVLWTTLQEQIEPLRVQIAHIASSQAREG